MTASYTAHSTSTKMVQCLWIRVNETGFILLKPDSTMGIGLYVWYLIPTPLPRASLPFPRVSLRALLSTLVAESPCGPEPCLQSAETRSTTSIKGLAARIWSADAGSLVFGERAALEQPIPTPLPVSCLTCCLKKSDDNLFFVVCTRYAG